MGVQYPSQSAGQTAVFAHIMGISEGHSPSSTAGVVTIYSRIPGDGERLESHSVWQLVGDE